MKNNIEEVINLLKESNLTLGSCESLTGGLFSSTVTSYSGVSKFYKGCICSYSTLVKHDLLKIDQDLIDFKGVVSKEIAYEMAKQASKLLDTDITISFTGNAGPTAMEGKEVGLVYIGLKIKDEIMTFEYHFDGNRNSIREQVVEEGFNLIKKYLGNN